MPKWEYLRLNVFQENGDEIEEVDLVENSGLPRKESVALFFDPDSPRGDPLHLDYPEAVSILNGLGWELVTERNLPEDQLFIATFRRPLQEPNLDLYYLLTDVLATHPNPAIEYLPRLGRLLADGLISEEQYTELVKLLKTRFPNFGESFERAKNRAASSPPPTRHTD